MKVLRPPLTDDVVRGLRAGDFVFISGRIVTARDKVYSAATSGKKPPIDMNGGVIYHCGPLAKKTKRGWKIISAGPTTSARMDSLQEDFVRITGAKALVGKGGVGEDVARGISRLGCVYLAFTGGAGVLAASMIKKVEKVVWPELGAAEAMWVLRVEKFGPLVVAIDTHGKNLYLRGKT
ncbi:MAG: FumA C-terminus/TtdB family hydratase beta subunit [Candidatus Hadarchaeota archaeon]